MPDAPPSRFHAWVHDGEPLWCPKGNHRLKTNFVSADAATVRCIYEEPGQSGDCGAKVFVVWLRHYGQKVCADLTREEIEEMRDLELTAEQMVKYIRRKTVRRDGH